MLRREVSGAAIEWGVVHGAWPFLGVKSFALRTPQPDRFDLHSRQHWVTPYLQVDCSCNGEEHATCVCHSFASRDS